MFIELNKSKVMSDDRVFIIRPIPGQKVKASLLDTGIYGEEGKNKLHAVKDNPGHLWGFKYEQGFLPKALRQKFISYSKLKAFLDIYLRQRNLQVVEVID